MKLKPWLLLFLLLLAACQAPEGSDTPRALIEWAATPLGERPFAATPTPFASATPAPLPTVEMTPVPTRSAPIPTMAPTPAAVGLYVKESDGLALRYPAAWVVLEETGQSLQLRDSEFGLFVSISSSFIDEEGGYDALVNEVYSPQLQTSFDLIDVTVASEAEVPFAGDRTARTTQFTAESATGQTFDFWIAYGETETRALSMFVFGLGGVVDLRQATLHAMLAQATYGDIQLFGQARDDTLVLLGGDPIEFTLDPARTTGSAAGYVGLLYGGLVRMAPTLELIPDLAESWAVSPDGTTYTFTLRDGLTFASGAPLTAAAVKASWERAAHPDTGSTTAATYMADIVGVAEMLAGEAEAISGVTAVDDRTLVVQLDGPKPYFIAKMTYPVFFVVNVAAVDDDDETDAWVFTPDASGPYTIARYVEDEAVVFTRNNAYHAPPAIPAVVYLTGRVGSALSLYEAGEIDVAYLNTISAERVRNPDDPLHDQWVTTTSMCTTYLQLNNTLPPFDDANVRRAFALAVDKAQFNEVIAEGGALVANTIFPPAMPGYAQAQAALAPGYDPEAARAALAASAYGADLPPITIGAAGFGDTERDDLNFLIAGWRQDLGVEVTITFLDPVNFSDVVRDTDLHMVSYGWCADYPDPENFVDVLFHSDSDFNVASFSDPALDALMEAARVELDPARRLALYQQIEAGLLETVAAIPLQHGISDAVVSPRIQGFVLSPMGAAVVPLLSFTSRP